MLAPAVIANIALLLANITPSFVSASPIGSLLDGQALIEARKLRIGQRDQPDEGEWNVKNHLGNLSPYFSAPSNGYTTELPAGCVVDQVQLMHRHGSRFPLPTELPYIEAVFELLHEHHDLLANVSEPFQFLKTWKPTLGEDNLTPMGRQELFNHGVEFNLTYPQFSTSLLLSSPQDRVLESAKWFQMGYNGRNYANQSKIVPLTSTVAPISWIRPSDTCSLWKYDYGLTAVNDWNAIYLPPIVSRINDDLPGFNFTADSIHGMLYACAYETAAVGHTPWCAVFESEEILDFEYELDLLMNYAFGYGLPQELGPILGSVYVNKLIERLTNATGNATDLYLEFGHDTTIDLALTALGLAKDTPNISASERGAPNATRRWMTSQQVPFAAKMITERISCTSSNTTNTDTWIRFLLNDAPFPILTCGDKMNSSTGACPLDVFVEVNAPSLAVNKTIFDTVCNNIRTT
ncbi:Multiple inositol polyphosphate phosphatase [Phaffia rhodozyma]|uniref:Multiple inositol polyphosphate phosphatase n=1 Tax=Phaffia rhodozyma TaxID=264483 RepID=A0A0F7SRP1_PHARH|nr:Multiple inositol polyphosphate phosphatase [Phaffia rhodozyma]